MTDWSLILAEHGPAVWRTVYRLLDHHADAQDCYQETILAAWRFAEREPVADLASLLVLRNSAPPEPVPAAATDLSPLSVAALSDKEREDDYVLASLLTSKELLTEGRIEREGLRRKSLEQCVAEAEVIVVAQALDFAPAPPNAPGDFPEHFIRFRVMRVLKGELAAREIKTRTPTAPGEFIGHEWVVMLSPENVAGKHFFAGCYTVNVEPEVKAILAKNQK